MGDSKLTNRGKTMHARVLKVQVPPENVDERANFYEGLLNSAAEASGCKDTLLLANPDTGEMLLITHWETDRDMKASEESGLFGELTSQCRYLKESAPERKLYEVRHHQ
jgi:heme-degrading monooxygenase HmoA